MGKNPDKGLIFKIKRFSIHDGPGIRTTVFLKGCPLKCTWCHSPEGISSDLEVWHYPDVCIGCGLCVSACRQNATELFTDIKNIVKINRNLCTLAGDCTRACPTGAIRFTGNVISVSEIVSEVLKDIVYYRSSGGGVTLTGGEPLFQPYFSAAILKSCREKKIHTAIETCLYAGREELSIVTEHTDLILADLKIDDPVKHKQYTGRSNAQVKENFRYLAGKGKNIIVRIPLVKEITDSEENRYSIIKFVHGINKEIPVEFIKYNPLTRNNYERLGIPFLINDDN